MSFTSCKSCQSVFVIINWNDVIKIDESEHNLIKDNDILTIIFWQFYLIC